MQTATATTALQASNGAQPHHINEALISITCSRGGVLSIPRNEAPTFVTSSLEDAQDTLKTSLDALSAIEIGESAISGALHTALTRITEATEATEVMQQLQKMQLLTK